MNTLNKEFILNGALVSLLLAGLVSWFGARDYASDSIGGLDRTFVFMVIFFVVFAFNLAVSLIHYLIGRAIKVLPLRLVIFNAAGLLLLAAAWLWIRDASVLAAYSSFLAYSAVSVIFHQFSVRTTGGQST